MLVSTWNKGTLPKIRSDAGDTQKSNQPHIA